MIYAFTENCALADQGLLDQAYALRHRVFVEELGWEALRRSDRLERDEFDNPDAIHMAFVSGGEVLAYTRLLPTAKPHLLSDVYPMLMQGKTSPRSSDIWEWTRLCAIADPALGRTSPIRFMMVAVAEIFVQMGLRALIAQSAPTWILRLRSLGWEAKPIALPIVYERATVVALEAVANEQTIADSRRRLNIRGAVLDLAALKSTEIAMVA